MVVHGAVGLEGGVDGAHARIPAPPQRLFQQGMKTLAHKKQPPPPWITIGPYCRVLGGCSLLVGFMHSSQSPHNASSNKVWDTPTHTLTLTHSTSLPHTRTLTHTHALSLSLSLSLTHTHAHTHSYSHSHTHTLTHPVSYERGTPVQAGGASSESGGSAQPKEECVWVSVCGCVGGRVRESVCVSVSV